MIINDEFAKEVIEGLERSLARIDGVLPLAKIIGSPAEDQIVERLTLKADKIKQAIAQAKEQIS